MSEQKLYFTKPGLSRLAQGIKDAAGCVPMTAAEVDVIFSGVFYPVVGLLLADGRRVSEPVAGAEIAAITFNKGGHRYLISPTVPDAYFSHGKVGCDGVEVEDGVNEASNRFNGQAQTEAMRKTLTADSGWAVNQAYMRTINGKHCWLPSMGELNLILSEKAAIDALLTGSGGTALPGGWYWSSSVANRTAEGYLIYMFGVNTNGGKDGLNVQGLYNVLSICEDE